MMPEMLEGPIDARGYCYKALSICFSLPEKEWQDADILGGLLEALKAQESEAVGDAALMKEILNETGEMEDLQVEYARLFVGPYELLAPPYGSVYLEGRRIMGDTTMAAIEFYRKVGLKLQDRVKEVPDHVRVQLEMMYFLIMKEAKAASHGEDALTEEYAHWQQEFFRKHFSTWVSDFAAQLEKATEQPFYRLLAKVLKAFVREEKELLLQG